MTRLCSISKVFSLAVLVSFAFTGSAVAQGDTYTLHSDSLDEEMIWGDGVQETETPLTVEVTKQDSYFQFEASSEAVDGDSEETVTFDVENDGEASYQIQHTDDGVWEISYPEDEEWSEFEALPTGFDAEMNTDGFTVQVPAEDLQTSSGEFRFGVQVSTDEGQLLYPDGDQLWYNGDTYVSSDHYQQLKIDYIDIVDFETQVLDSQLNTLASELELVEDDVDVNTDDIEEAIQDIDQLRTDLDNLDEEDIDGLDERFEDELSSLDAEIRNHVDSEISQVESQVQEVQDTYLTEQQVEDRLEETEENLREYSDETDTGDTQIEYEGFTDYLRQFWESQANFIKDWVRDNFATEERVDAVEDRQDQQDAEIKQLERQLDQLYDQLDETDTVDVEREGAVDTAQQVMLQNEIDELDVEDEQGRNWSCKLRETGFGEEQARCITSD